jgi:hypothetical protein
MPWEQRPLSRRGIVGWTIGAMVGMIALATSVAVGLTHHAMKTNSVVAAHGAEVTDVAKPSPTAPSPTAPGPAALPSATAAAPPIVPLAALPKARADSPHGRQKTRARTANVAAAPKKPTKNTVTTVR